MSDTAAREAMERMNLREVAVSPIYSTLAADLHKMAVTDPAEAMKKFMEHRRTELCEAYGFTAAPKQEKPFAFANGIAIIPFSGSLINRFGQSYSFITGYNFIRRQMALAMADEDVKGIIGDFNTPGGEAAGCFECSDEIFAMRGTKPMIAVVDSNAYSAGYALASAFDKIVCTPSGGVGSIGVVAMHMNVGKALEKFGVEITYIHFGEHKVDGNPYEALSPEVKKQIQTGVNKSGEAFVALVARNRNIGADKVKATEARTYRAEEALSLGLIDTIAPPQKAMQVFFDELTGSVINREKEDAMSVETKPGAQDQATQEAASAAAIANAANAARVAERARVHGIQSCEEAKGREKLASHLAMNTDMSVDQAKAMLAVAATEQPQATAPAANGFQAVMDKSQHPNVGADTNGGNGTAPVKSEDKLNAILADYAAAGGALDQTA
jgi:signal peptide peptidase SppA